MEMQLLREPAIFWLSVLEGYFKTMRDDVAGA
jgi:hypothetical protein